jgi:hypothetical protein
LRVGQTAGAALIDDRDGHALSVSAGYDLVHGNRLCDSRDGKAKREKADRNAHCGQVQHRLITNVARDRPAANLKLSRNDSVLRLTDL